MVKTNQIKLKPIKIQGTSPNTAQMYESKTPHPVSNPKNIDKAVINDYNNESIFSNRAKSVTR